MTKKRPKASSKITPTQEVISSFRISKTENTGVGRVMDVATLFCQVRKSENSILASKPTEKGKTINKIIINHYHFTYFLYINIKSNQ